MNTGTGNVIASILQKIKHRKESLNRSMHRFSLQMKAWFSRIYPGLRKTMAVLVILTLAFFFPLLVQQVVILTAMRPGSSSLESSADLQPVSEGITKELAGLDRRLKAKIPRSYYLVINSAANEFSLYRNTELVRSDKCSTGSYVLLKNGAEQQWMFKTPKGEFRIQGKTTSPVWKKPDWAFVEEGLPVPPANHFTRYEYGVLGDYALSLGDGYLIHGTLYQRFLGLPVTHGCIRLNDENLKLVYQSLDYGSKVFIF